MEKQEDILFKLNLIASREGLEERIPYILISNIYKFLYDINLIKIKDDALYETAKEMNKYVSTETIKGICNFVEGLSLGEIKSIIYSLLSGQNSYLRVYNDNSNDYICKLIYDLLKIDNSKEIVMDFGSGIGNILANINRECNKQGKILRGLLGIEINPELAHLSKMALSILVQDSFDFKVINGNALEKNDYSYSKAYVFPSFGTGRLLANGIRQSYLFPELTLSNKNTSDWLFIDSMLYKSSWKRCIALVTGKALFNNEDIEYRNKIIKDGFLEGIIELPNGSLLYSGIKVYMLIFSRNNKAVRFVDASEVIDCQNKRYVNLELPIKEIENMYNADNVRKKDVNELDGVLNLCPSKVLLNIKRSENGIKLKDISKILTGNQYTFGVFEKKGLISKEHTDYKILTSSDIDNGIVDWDSLHSIKMDSNKFDKFAVHYGDVVITSKSSKVKIVVVDIEPSEKILVTGGMIFIRPQLNKLNPTYLKMYLESENGQAVMKSIQKGNIIITLTANDLSNIEIPLIPIDKQNIKAEKYNEKLSTIVAYTEEIKRIKDSLKNIFEEED